MTNNEIFETIKNNLTTNYNNQLRKLKELKEQLLIAEQNQDNKKVAICTRRINSILESINNIKSILSCIRPNKESDLRERNEIINNFSTLVNESIPDDIPLVFHGNRNIEIVKQIIASGGLYTPEERNVGYKSFATQIDVTAKSNIKVSLEFADSSVNSFMPYGAIFVFYPKEHEYEKVLSTGDNSEVFGGVESINFNEERFVGIITTDENIETLKECMKENNFDPNKVFNHKQFIELCKEKFSTKNKVVR